MDGFELNKIAGAILLMGILMMVTGKIAGALYHPKDAAKRGYEVEVADVGTAGAGGGQSAAPVDVAALLAVANADNGKKLFNKCVTCHTINSGGANNVGPNLHGIFGAGVCHQSDFAYSDAMRAKGGKWTAEELYAFLKNPKRAVKGTKMAFAGFRKPQDIADLIAYLKAN